MVMVGVTPNCDSSMSKNLFQWFSDAIPGLVMKSKKGRAMPVTLLQGRKTNDSPRSDHPMSYFPLPAGFLVENHPAGDLLVISTRQRPPFSVFDLESRRMTP